MKKLNLLIMSFVFTATFLNGQLINPTHPEDHTGRNAQMNDYCRTCHTCEYPTVDNPCLLQCARKGAMFSSEYSFEAGPEIVVIERLVNNFGPVTFYHELHASMSDIGEGCTICHHFSEESGEIPSCSKCHKDQNDLTRVNMPSLKGAYHRQCLACHREWSHSDDCQFCHKEIGSSNSVISSIDKTDIVGVPHPLITAEEKYVYTTDYPKAPVVTFHHVDHVELFGLECSDCHKGDSCSRCHDADKSKDNVHQVKHVETCCNCHLEKNCNFCHSNTEKPPFNHDHSTDFVLGEYHNKIDCNKCHRSVNNFVTPSTNCDDCHTQWDVDSFNHEVTGLILNEYHEEEDCEVCHINHNFKAVPTCDFCHDGISYPEYSPGKQNQAN